MEYTYEDIKRERLISLLSGLILELSWQDDIKMFKDTTLNEVVSYKDVTEIFIDKLSCLDDERFDEFKKKIVELLCEIL